MRKPSSKKKAPAAKKSTAKKTSAKKQAAKKSVTKKASQLRQVAKGEATKKKPASRTATKGAAKTLAKTPDGKLETATPTATSAVHRAALGKRQPRPKIEIGADELEFIRAIDEYKAVHHVAFPSCSELLYVLKKLGYRRR